MRFKKLLFIFLIPIIIFFLFELLFTTIYVERVYNLFENILFGFLIVLFSTFIVNYKLNLFFLRISYITLYFILFLETAYYYIFNVKFTLSSIDILLETNTKEIGDFVFFYSDWLLIILIILTLVIVIFLLTKISILISYNLFKLNFLGRVILFILLLSIFIFSPFIRRENLPYLALKSIYNNELTILRYNIEQLKNPLGNFKSGIDSTALNSETHVIIIGESTFRSHMNLYNYYRNTTPLLNALKNELFVYKDVISPHAATIESLMKALTLGNYESIESIKEGSIIQLLNSYGYTTYWLSNQAPFGLYESSVTKLSKACNKRKFINAKGLTSQKSYDELLLPELNRILYNDKQRRLIFIQLQGTHLDYSNRYPKRFNTFINKPRTNFNSTEIHNTINAYDNAILYNDYIASTIINKVKALNTTSFVLYFSDHGEEVYDTINFAGHNDDVGTLPMFEIPFILWQSDKFKLTSDIDLQPNRKYMIDDLFHSIADLTQIDHPTVDKSRSIFSTSFKERKRYILSYKDYDSLRLLSKPNY